MYASLAGYTNTVQILISFGANVNEMDNNGTTAVMYASRNGHSDIVEIFQSLDGNANM